jgi:hypothetical protein
LIGELQRPTAPGKQLQETFLTLPIPFAYSFC